MVLPEIKEYKETDGTCILSCQLNVEVESSILKKSCRLLEIFLPGCKANSTSGKKHIITKQTRMQAEEYRLYIRPDEVKIEYCTYPGLRNAFATIAMLARKEGDEFRFPCVEIHDFPVAAHRGVMLDLARGIKPLDDMIEDIILIAKSKMNYLHLHLFDSAGSCVKLNSLPEECCIENFYTRDEMYRIIELADVLALDIIPEFDMPAHSKKLVKYFEEFACDTDEESSGWTICAGEEKVYAFYQKVIEELSALFPGEYIHIGADELEFADMPKFNCFCHWGSCRKCVKKCKEEGLSDRQELFYYFVRRIYDMVKQSGKKMIMWSDQLDCSRVISLPKDIIMHFWRVAAEGRGPVDGCSMEAQIDAGYTIINSYYDYVYCDIEECMTAEKFKDWHWEACSIPRSEVKGKILGSELCAWSYGKNNETYDHYKYSFAPTIVVMADKLWNGENLNFDSEYQQALTRAVLDQSTPVGLNLFQCFGSVIPPKDGSLAYYDKIKCDKTVLQETIEVLKSIPNVNRCGIYIKCIETILQNM